LTQRTLGHAIARYELSEDDRRDIDVVTEGVLPVPFDLEDPACLAALERSAFTLPADLVRFVTSFRYTEATAAVIVSGFKIDDRAIGPTPSHWKANGGTATTLKAELFLLLVASLLGDVFGWATLQGGRLVQNVLPIRNQEHEQSGHGSLAYLAWHTEDAFHPFRCDYLGLMAMRNHDRVPTTLASVDAIDLPVAVRRVLAEPRFRIRPDDEHLNQTRREALTDAGVPSLPRDWTEPPATAVLFGGQDTPYLRIDPIFMQPLENDPEADFALRMIVDQLEAALEDVVLDAGSVCIIDNFHAVHGRRSFRSRYDGTDRWLKKVLVTRDIRRSRAARRDVGSRVVEPTLFED